jgi:hypothetical protein
MHLEDRSSRVDPLRLVAGPALFVVAVALGFASNAVGQIGPVDRAVFGWAVVVPMLLAAPIVAGRAGRAGDPAMARRAILVAAVLVAIGTIAVFALTADHVGCSGPLPAPERIRAAVPVGVVAAAAYGLPAWIAFRTRAGTIEASVAGLLAGIGGWAAVLFAFVVSYGVGASCAFAPT